MSYTYPIKYVFTLNGLVVAAAIIYVPEASSSGPEGSTEYILPGNSPVDVGWVETGTPENPSFDPPAA